MAGCPNITGQLNMNVQYSDSSGVLYSVGGLSGIAEAYRDYTGNYAIGFSASRSSTVYGKSSTVTPLSLSTKFFIKY